MLGPANPLAGLATLILAVMLVLKWGARKRTIDSKRTSKVSKSISWLDSIFKAGNLEYATIGLVLTAFLIALGAVNNFPSFFLSIVGTTVLVLYQRLKDLRTIEEASPTLDSEMRKREYEILNDEVKRRGDLLAIHGTIFVVASFILLGQASSISDQFGKTIVVYLALLIHAIFLLGDAYPAKKLDNITFRRLRGIETQDGFEAHKFILDKTHKDPPVSARRHLWSLFFTLVFISGLLLLP